MRAARRPQGWLAPGPTPTPPVDPGALWPGPEEDLCWLAGNWRILQRTDGHRFSLDDLVTAHLAATITGAHPPGRHLDLGCGIGSVLLFVAWRFPEARCLGVEAQGISAALARRSIAWNGAVGRVEVRAGDFRDPEIVDALAAAPAFDLVTGTPPYFPVGTGVESDGIQRGPCRFEHRGGIEDYCKTAARVLAPGAPFVACEAWLERERVAPAARAAGLTITRWRDVIPRAGKEPLFSVFAMRAEDHADAGPAIIDSPLVVRDQAGQRTRDFIAVRAVLGMPP
jgi:tRNA1(Val) A37 N6-methylase TrmN6